MGELSLKHAAVIYGAVPGAGWSLRKAVAANPSWPAFNWPTGTISVRDLVRRYSAPGKALTEFRQTQGNVWKHLSRPAMVAELRLRTLDPAVIEQRQTSLCGPMAILFELARRQPSRYIRWADKLLRAGEFTTLTGEVIETESDLREVPVPFDPEFEKVAQVDWFMAAAMRDHENIWADVDDGGDLEGLTLPGAMRTWTAQVLGLRATSFPCWGSGGRFVTPVDVTPVAALNSGFDAIQRGGVAFVLVDADLIKDGSDETEEDAWWMERGHKPGKQVGAWGKKWTHSRDDNFPPNHWVTLLDVVHPGEDRIRLRLWSWGSEFRVDAALDSIGEYIYEVVTGD